MARTITTSVKFPLGGFIVLILVVFLLLAGGVTALKIVDLLFKPIGGTGIPVIIPLFFIGLMIFLRRK